MCYSQAGSPHLLSHSGAWLSLHESAQALRREVVPPREQKELAILPYAGTCPLLVLGSPAHVGHCLCARLCAMGSQEDHAANAHAEHVS